jgi:hypothetical protein
VPPAKCRVPAFIQPLVPGANGSNGVGNHRLLISFIFWQWFQVSVFR